MDQAEGSTNLMPSQVKDRWFLNPTQDYDDCEKYGGEWLVFGCNQGEEGNTELDKLYRALQAKFPNNISATTAKKDSRKINKGTGVVFIHTENYNNSSQVRMVAEDIRKALEENELQYRNDLYYKTRLAKKRGKYYSRGDSYISIYKHEANGSLSKREGEGEPWKEVLPTELIDCKDLIQSLPDAQGEVATVVKEEPRTNFTDAPDEVSTVVKEEPRPSSDAEGEVSTVIKEEPNPSSDAQGEMSTVVKEELRPSSDAQGEVSTVVKEEPTPSSDAQGEVSTVVKEEPRPSSDAQGEVSTVVKEEPIQLLPSQDSLRP